MNIRRDILLPVLLALLPLASEAKVRLPHVIGDNMVLQQNTDARLWGWTDKGRRVVVRTSWSKERYACTAGDDGRWEVFVHTPAASYEPLSITISDGDELTLKNLLAGEVWACGGQSNMELRMQGDGNCPVEGFIDEQINASEYSGVRFFFAEPTPSFEPQDDVKGQWKVTSAETIGSCSAVAYFFGQTLNRVLGVPIGLVIACKGATPIESWLNRANLKAHTGEPTDSVGMAKNWGKDTPHYPLVWYNGTLRPVEKYTLRGMIFYQGCSNVSYNDTVYARRLALFAQQCRQEFANDTMPFRYVQTAPMGWNPINGCFRAIIREQQMKALSLIKNSSIVCTMDLVYPWELKQIHPAQKRQVGQRLAMQALKNDYGFEKIPCESPKFQSMTVKGRVCLLSFTDTYGGFSRLSGLEGFEIAGDDRIFHNATGKVKSGQELEVWSDEVEKPVAVRYCFRNFKLGNVANQAYLPLLPFRTDDWPITE